MLGISSPLEHCGIYITLVGSMKLSSLIESSLKYSIVFKLHTQYLYSDSDFAGDVLIYINHR